MALIRTYIPVAPVPKPRMTARDRWGTNKRPAVARYHQFKDDLRNINIPPISPKIEVSFVVPMPHSWSEAKRKDLFGKPHQQKPDIDNYLKAFLDALCEDDSYVYSVSMTKRWGILGSIELITDDGQEN